MNHQTSNQVSLWRILGSMMYDGIILFALFLIGNLLIAPIYLYFQDAGQPISQSIQTHITEIICFILTTGYYLLQYTRAGQTVGQRAWQFKIAQPNGLNASFGQYAIRYMWSWILPFLFYIGLSHLPHQYGANYQALIILAPLTNLMYCFFNKERNTLHGILSGTHFFNIPKPPKK